MFSLPTYWGDILLQDKFGVFDSVYKWEILAGRQDRNLAPKWHEAKKKVLWVKMTHTKTKKRWANALIPVRTKCPCGVPPYIVLMHTARDHAVNLRGRRLNIVCGTVKEEWGWQTTLRYRALSYTVTSIANVATPACPSLPQRKDTLGRCP